MTIYLICYLLLINAAAYAVMRFDKQMAKKHLWRVPETTLFGLAAIGGSVGCLVAMYTVRHKTRHLSFTLGIPAILAVQLAAVYYLFIK